MQHCKIKCSYFKALPVATPTLRDPAVIKLPLAVVNPQDGPPLFLDQTEAQRAEQIFFGDCPPSQDDPLPPLISKSGSGTAWLTEDNNNHTIAILSRQLFPNTGTNVEGVLREVTTLQRVISSKND